MKLDGMRPCEVEPHLLPKTGSDAVIATCGWQLVEPDLTNTKALFVCRYTDTHVDLVDRDITSARFCSRVIRGLISKLGVTYC